MSSIVREFHRKDREQLTALVNTHVASVLPGVALSTNIVLSQLEREPGDLIVDPWVDQRSCLVAVEEDAIVGAALLLRFSDDDRVRVGYRSAAEIRWIVVTPSAPAAGQKLLRTVLDTAKSWQPSHIYADGSLPAPGCIGISNTWPHIRELLTSAGFDGPTRSETVLAAPCEDLVGHRLDGTEVRRSAGVLGTRFDLVSATSHLGYIEVGEVSQALARSASAASWTDVGNLFATEPERLTSVMPPLLSAAAEWLTLGGVERLIDYYADDVHPPEYLTVLQQLGFVPLTTNERGWTFHV